MILSKKHIIYTLGVDIPPLQENYNLSYITLNLIKEEQILYESFLDTIKSFAKDRINKVVDTIKDWKDAAVVFFKILSSGELLDDFLYPLKRRVETILKKLYEFLKKAGLESWVNKIKKFLSKILSLKGWKQMFALLSLGGISYYVLEKLPKDGIKGFIQEYFTDEFVENIIGKLTNWQTFIGWLGPIVGGVGIIFSFIKPILDQFREAFKSTSKFATKLIKENKMKKSELKETIKNEILALLKENEGEKLKPEVASLKKYLESSGKSALSQINDSKELKGLLNIIWNGMNESFKKNSTAIALKKIIDAKL